MPTYRPHVIVRERLPQTFDRDCLSVVHVTFGRVVSQDAVEPNSPTDNSAKGRLTLQTAMPKTYR